MTSLHLLNLYHKPIIGFYSTSSANRLPFLCEYLRTNTWRRTTIALTAQFLSRGNMFRRLPVYKNMASNLIKCANKVLSEPLDDCIVCWQSDYSRDRIYGFGLSKGMASPVFIKYGIGCNNASLFGAEAIALANYSGSSYEFRVPKLIGSSITENESVLLTATIPLGARIHQKYHKSLPKQIVALRNDQQCVKAESLINTSWWKDFLSVAGEEATSLLEKASAILHANGYVRVSPCHGDAGSENIFEYESEIHVIDWERHHAEAPYLTDAIGYWLGANHRMIAEGRVQVMDRLIGWAESQGYGVDDVYLALAYLVGCRFRPAIQIAAQLEGRAT